MIVYQLGNNDDSNHGLLVQTWKSIYLLQKEQTRRDLNVDEFDTSLEVQVGKKQLIRGSKVDEDEIFFFIQ